ncbi:cell wall-active antibiotics response protein LiaF [candidate division KSB1 bacterium]
MRDTRAFVVGGILIFFGIMLVIDSTLGLDFILDLWPLILVYIGWQIIRRAQASIGDKNKAAEQEKTDIPEGLPTDMLHQTSFIGDTSIRITSQQFQGGTITSFFGDIHLNLSEIDVSDVEKPIKITSIIGDVNITLPKDFTFRIRGNSVIGDIYILGQKTGGIFRHLAYRSEGYTGSDKKLLITVSSLIGDMHIA